MIKRSFLCDNYHFFDCWFNHNNDVKVDVNADNIVNSLLLEDSLANNNPECPVCTSHSVVTIQEGSRLYELVNRNNVNQGNLVTNYRNIGNKFDNSFVKLLNIDNLLDQNKCLYDVTDDGVKVLLLSNNDEE